MARIYNFNEASYPSLYVWKPSFAAALREPTHHTLAVDLESL